jgi:hypothetical protein
MHEIKQLSGQFLSLIVVRGLRQDANPYLVGKQRMGFPERHGSGRSGRKKFLSVPKGCSGQYRNFQGPPAAKSEEGRVKVGLRPVSQPDSYS